MNELALLRALCDEAAEALSASVENWAWLSPRTNDLINRLRAASSADAGKK